MKVLVIGSNGFVGRNVVKVLSQNYKVFSASRQAAAKKNDVVLDLADPSTILRALHKIQPDIIIHAAGIVENSEASAMNPILTRNLLQQVLNSGKMPLRIIISGSAAEYGEVSPKDLPVKETAPLHPTSPYRKSKIDETNLALEFRNLHGLPIVIARIFNPLGPGMQPKFLTSRILTQIEEFKSGSREALEVSRLDSERDYVDISDLSRGIETIIEHDPKHNVYNIGSGKATTNGELIDLILKHSHLKQNPDIIETATEPEPLVASQADISRMRQEFGWEPSVTLEDTVKGIVNAAG